MKITKEQFKGIVREVMIDESEYQEFFKRALEKTGKSIPNMSDEEKKAFFNKIDSAWDAKGEKNEELVGNQHKLDVDKDGDIGADDLAALRAGKTNEAMASGAWVGIEKTPKGPKLVKTFKSGNEAKAWVMKSPGGHSIMTKKDWDVSEGKSVNEDYDGPAVLKTGDKNALKVGEKITINSGGKKKEYKVVKSNGNGDFVLHLVESVNEASKKPTIKVVSKLKNEQGIQIVVTKTTKGETMYGGFVVRGKLQKVIPVGANNSKEGVKKRALQIWDEFGKQLGEYMNEEIKVGQMVKVDNPHWEAALGKKGPFRRKVKMIDHDNVFFTDGSNSSMKYIKESVNEAGDERFDWPPVLNKFKGKEIEKLEAEYKASLDKSSAILDKQRQLIRTTLGNKFEFPWENYDKWPAKLKAEVEKLNSQIDKEREKHPAMFKKLMQARGTWR
jgi:hypothetical protein